jgi:hypothetical protein
MASLFNDYSTPNDLAAYSAHFFNILTFRKAAAMDYPQIAPAGTISQWVFDDVVPGSGSATLIMPGEVVPHINDLHSILQLMEGAFRDGKRSVVVTTGASGETSTKWYHFSKVSPPRL